MATPTTADMIQFFNDNPAVLSDFLSLYLESNPITPQSEQITAYLQANPSIITSYITANPQLVTDFIAKSTPELADFVKQNPDLIASLLNEAIKPVWNPFSDVIFTAFGYDLTVERAILIGIPVIFSIILFFQKNIFSYAMILLWVVIGAITGTAAYGITKLPEMFRPVARLAGNYIGTIAVAIFGLLSVLVILLGIFTGMLVGAAHLLTPAAPLSAPLTPATLVPK